MAREVDADWYVTDAGRRATPLSWYDPVFFLTSGQSARDRATAILSFCVTEFMRGFVNVPEALVASLGAKTASAHSPDSDISCVCASQPPFFALLDEAVELQTTFHVLVTSTSAVTICPAMKALLSLRDGFVEQVRRMHRSCPLVVDRGCPARAFRRPCDTLHIASMHMCLGTPMTFRGDLQLQKSYWLYPSSCTRPRLCRWCIHSVLPVRAQRRSGNGGDGAFMCRLSHYMCSLADSVRAVELLCDAATGCTLFRYCKACAPPPG